MRRTFLVFVSLLLSSGSLLAKSLDRINWADRAAWNCAKTIAVKPFGLSGEFKGPKSQDEYMKYFVGRLAAALVRPGGIEKVFLVNKGDPPMESDVIITGDFLELSVGSRAARFWVGFGAGTAKCEVRIRAYRPDERTPLFDLEHGRVSPFSLSGDANLGDIEAVVGDIGEELLRQKSTCDPAAVHPLEAPPSPTAAAKEPTQVSIESSVANADVFVDGQFAGNAPLPNFRLTPGTHVIEVKAPSFVPWKRELTVVEGASTRVVAQLERAP